MLDKRCLSHCMLVALLFGHGKFVVAEIYKWTDDNGNVVYGDKPDSSKAKTIKIKKAPPTDQKYQQRLDKRQRLLDTMDDEREARLAEEKQMAEREALQEERCKRVQADLTRMQSASYLYEETNDPFNPTILTDAQRKQKQQKYRKYLDENC